MRKIALIILVLSAFGLKAQFGTDNQATAQPVKVTVSETSDSANVYLTFKFEVERNWIVYDSIIGEGGPIPFTYSLSAATGLSAIKMEKPKLKKKHDDLMDVDVLYFAKSVEYKLTLKKTSTTYSYSGTYEFMCCNLTTGVCLPPTSGSFSK